MIQSGNPEAVISGTKMGYFVPKNSIDSIPGTKTTDSIPETIYTIVSAIHNSYSYNLSQNAIFYILLADYEKSLLIHCCL